MKNLQDAGTDKNVHDLFRGATSTEEKVTSRCLLGTPLVAPSIIKQLMNEPYSVFIPSAYQEQYNPYIKKESEVEDVVCY
jgi:hypothetical protein